MERTLKFFAPIAIVGQGCVLPGALDPQQLWNSVLEGRDVLGEPPESYWGLDPDAISTSPDGDTMDRTWSKRGGYVRGFDEQFDPSGFLLDEAFIRGLDPLFRWTLEAARQAWRDAGKNIQGEDTHRGGVILGNLSYPTRSLAEYAESVWRGEDDRIDAHNRYMSGLPSHLIAQALGLRGGSFSLDAACASSLYAIKIACDRLQEGSADVMLAGGVNHADDLFLHVGFCALNAMSKTGRSRPFNKGADGLVPAEGAGFVVLKRLEDAVRDGDAIAGVIRGVGLSNDGRGRGMLTPSEEGQWRAMRDAYEMSGLTPEDITLVECHATGTPLGDGTELRSMARIFEQIDDVPIGSLKSNMGHLITASGVAGLLKMLAAMKHETRPSTLHVDEPIEWLGETPFRPIASNEAWEVEGLRRAAINNFGFGGNNAHLLVEEWKEQTIDYPGAAGEDVVSVTDCPVAIVGASVIAGSCENLEQFEQALLGAPSGAFARSVSEISFDVKDLRFPPNDLKHALGQQLLALKSGLLIKEQIDTLPTERTGIYMGMQCDSEIARYGVRWRMVEHESNAETLEASRESVVSGLVAAGVLGTMPNIVANRLNSQFNLSGPSYTVSSEEASGIVALELAARALRHGELDAALVGAVDLCCDPVHEAAAKAVLPEDRQTSGDAAVLLVVKRLEDAERDGDNIIAIIGEEAEAEVILGDGEQARSLTSTFGHAHAASGLLHVAAGALLCQRHALLPATSEQSATPWFSSSEDRSRVASVRARALGEQSAEIALRSYSGKSGAHRPTSPNRVHLFSASSLEQLQTALEEDRHAEDIALPWRLSVVCNASEYEARKKAALAALAARAGNNEVRGIVEELAPGIYLGHGDLDGETSLVFTGPAGAYPKMGGELLVAHPDLLDEVSAQFANLEEAVGWIYEPGATRERPPVDKLWGSSFLCQVHARLTRGVLGIKPEAAIGFCSGETNAIFAMGAWRGLDAMHSDIERDGVFDRALGGELEVLKQSWQSQDVDWETYRVLADEDTVREALEGEDRAYLTIINCPGDLVIAGEKEACERVIARIGGHRARSLGYNIVMHCPEARGFEQTWHALHHRPTEPVPGVRFYTHSTLSSYEASADAIADALTGQAMQTVDFPALIRKAWEDGVRVFIEHGPQSGCAQWIRKILGDKPHLAVSLDEYRRTDIEQINHALGKLAAAGLSAQYEKWCAAVTSKDDVASAKPGFQLAFPAHLPAVSLPARSTGRKEQRPENQSSPVRTPMSASSRDNAPYQVMSPAPALPSALQDTSALGQPTPVVLPAQGEVARSSRELPPREVTRGSQVEEAAAPSSSSRVAPVSSAPTQDPSSKVRSVVASQFEHISRMHQQFMAQQQQMQQRFMQTRQNMVHTLISQANQGATAPTAPTARHHEEPAVSEVFPVTLIDHVQQQPEQRISTRSTSAPAARAPKSEPASPQPSTPVAKTKAPAPKSVKQSKKVPKAHAVKPKSEKRAPVGPTFDYEQIKIHASGKISDIFGPLFEQQDDFPIQVRMPEPPLLLCHRVTGIDCEAGVVGTGSLWCESDIPSDAWFLHADRMPVGIMIESGQADLMLISYMGADFDNRGDRCYRLLGCELTFHGGLPRPGETLAYDIHIDGHAKQNDIRLFFFHYDCEVDGEVRLSVRHGQAGFFTYDELADSKGILWKPSDEDADAIAKTPFADAPALASKRSFSAEEVQAFADGKVYDTFGAGFERAGAHTATPGIQADRMRFMDEVLEFDPHGGPWDRGYLKAVQHISSDDWFFDGHFKNDPCMPGTLMFEGCVQTMAFYMAACGWTIDRDGWVFEPVPEVAYTLRCRGQVTPSSRELIYEVFVREVHDGETPKLFADLLCTVDGLGAFHCARMGLQLVPDWPMDQLIDMNDYEEPKPVASVNGFDLGYDSLLACAWGRPTRAFGEMYAPFDSHRTVARLPGPPYHFISRVTEIDPEAQNAMRSGVDLTVEYDVPADAWYFHENGAAVMPYAVLLEAGLQPCGWLASYVGCALTRDDIDLAFRNLDGTTHHLLEVTPETGTLQTKARLLNIARAAGNIIVSFHVEMFAIDQPGSPKVMEMDTVFGFFPPESLAAQVGVGKKPEFEELFSRQSDMHVDLTARPAPFFDASPQLAQPMMLMIDRFTGWWPEAGAAGLGQARAEKDVDPNEWFFKAHFFQDPVQPGSLGLEALLQLLQVAMIQKGMGEGIEDARFEAIAVDIPMSWKYRGQVVPTNKTISSTLELLEIGEDERGVWAKASGSLWVDGMRIYHASEFGMRIVSGKGDPEPGARIDLGEKADKKAESSELKGAQQTAEAPQLERELTLDPEVDTWLGDHCPTYTRPALPMMSIVDLLAEQALLAAPGFHVSEISNVELRKWVIFDGPLRMRTRAESIEGQPHHYRVALDLWWEAPRQEMSRFDEVASATVRVSDVYDAAPDALGPLIDARPCDDLYESAQLFHGPTFQVVSSALRGSNGASATLDTTRSGVPVGALNPALLDGALQSIPHDQLQLWWEEAGDDSIAYPHAVEKITVHSVTPHAGNLRAEVRFEGGEGRIARFAIQVFSGDVLWVAIAFSEILMPKGPLGRLEATQRRAFIRDKAYVPGASLSSWDGESSILRVDDVQSSDWFKGTISSIYDLDKGSLQENVARIVAKEHLAGQLAIHPSKLHADLERQEVYHRDLAVTPFPVELEVGSGSVSCRGEVVAAPAIPRLQAWWRDRLGVEEGWFGDDLYGGLVDRFVSSVHFQDIDALAALRGRSVLFLGNHEVQIESLLITILASALTDTTVITMANAKHEQGWVGNLIRDIFSYPGCEDPENIVYFQQQDRESMFALLDGLKRSVKERAASIMVHAPGTRAVKAGESVERISSLFLDLAIELDLPIVPVYFDKGLPVEPLQDGKLEFPVGQTGQAYHFGRPILPEELGALEYAKRRAHVLEGINALGPSASRAVPGEPDHAAVSRIEASRANGMDEINATLFDILSQRAALGEDSRTILSLARGEQEVLDEVGTPRREWLMRIAKRFSS